MSEQLFYTLWPTLSPTSIPNGIVNLGYAAAIGGFASKQLGYSVLSGVRVGTLAYGTTAVGMSAYNLVKQTGADDEGTYAYPAIKMTPRTLEKDWFSKILEQELKDGANTKKFGDAPLRDQQKRV